MATRLKNGEGEREHPDYYTRDIGGHFRNNQPHISGYFQIICGLPSLLFNGDENVKSASEWLHSTCEGFTPHTQALTKVDVQGMGQVGASFVANVTTTREFTLTFREYQNLPILNIIKSWASVFDPFTGVSPLSGNEFIPENYKGWIAVAQTKPVRSQPESFKAEDIEACYIYNGVWPTNIPLDSLNSDQATNDVVQHSVTFSFDGSPLTSAEPSVTDQVIELLDGMQVIGDGNFGKGSTYKQHHDAALNTSQWGAHKNTEIETISKGE
jgi:hypothetical protein